jgi:hypothetical protein
MKMLKLLNIMILLISLKFVNTSCIKKCFCVSESELRCYNFELKDYNDFVSLALKRRIIHFYKSAISLSKLTAIMSQLTSVIIANDCHVIDCLSLYKTHIDGCNVYYNGDNDVMTTELSSITDTMNNTNVTWITLVGCVLAILTLAICITVLR